jgi:hypothetical protein
MHCPKLFTFYADGSKKYFWKEKFPFDHVSTHSCSDRAKRSITLGSGLGKSRKRYQTNSHTHVGIEMSKEESETTHHK